MARRNIIVAGQFFTISHRKIAHFWRKMAQLIKNQKKGLLMIPPHFGTLSNDFLEGA